MGNKSKNDLPGYLEKRKLLYDPGTPSERLRDVADRFAEHGHLSDAIEFYGRAGCEDRLEALLEKILSEGDTFLCEQVGSALNRSLTVEQWAEVGKQAMEKKKYGYALRAFEKAGDDDSKFKVKTMMSPDTEGQGTEQ